MKCPIKLDKIHCVNCSWSKPDGTGKDLCDWPYHQGMTPEEIKEVTTNGDS